LQCQDYLYESPKRLQSYGRARIMDYSDLDSFE
jgi:hypothetical protein